MAVARALNHSPSTSKESCCVTEYVHCCLKLQQLWPAASLPERGIPRLERLFPAADQRRILQARAAVLTAAQCATYNEAKTAWMNMTNGGDTLSTHVGASMISGLVTTTLTAPVDVIKTNMFVGKLLLAFPAFCCLQNLSEI